VLAGGVLAAGAVLVAVALGSGGPVAPPDAADAQVECVTPAEGCPVVQVAPVPAHPSPVVAPRATGSPYTLRALQMNLCDSGLAHCYTGGRAVTEAAAKIATVAPDIVTLNEVCQRDVLGSLLAAMAAAHPSEPVVAAFQPAWNRSRRAPYRCTDGDSYGDGVIVAAPAAGYRGSVVSGGTYPESMQDPTDDEERGWVCVGVRGEYYGCASHLVAYHPALAARQCAQLLGGEIPGFVGTHGAAPVIVGSDLNLADNGGHTYDVRFCAPFGYYVEDDPGLPSVEPQHFVVSGTLAFRSVVDLDMEGTTDHPALLLTVQAAGAPPR
jgi:hypothetical protein